jgi:hypothetical protein
VVESIVGEVTDGQIEADLIEGPQSGQLPFEVVVGDSSLAYLFIERDIKRFFLGENLLQWPA